MQQHQCLEKVRETQKACKYEKKEEAPAVHSQKDSKLDQEEKQLEKEILEKIKPKSIV